MSERDIVQWMKINANQAVAYLYKQYRDEFFTFARRYTTDDSSMVDAFQEAIIAFYEYCIKGKYDPERSSPKTMLFGIARYTLLNAKKKQGRIIGMEDLSDLRLEDEIVDHFIDEELTEKQLRIKEGLSILNENCRKIISLFYFFEYSIEAIVKEMGYQNGNVVRSHKSRCLKRLREHLKE